LAVFGGLVTAVRGVGRSAIAHGRVKEAETGSRGQSFQSGHARRAPGGETMGLTRQKLPTPAGVTDKTV
jgi:hypothetical protein